MGMQISYTGKYQQVIELAREHNATDVSFQYHVFVNFTTLHDAESFLANAEAIDLKPLWDDVNTGRPGIPFEVVIGRWN